MLEFNLMTLKVWVFSKKSRLKIVGSHHYYISLKIEVRRTCEWKLIMHLTLQCGELTKIDAIKTNNGSCCLQIDSNFTFCQVGEIHRLHVALFTHTLDLLKIRKFYANEHGYEATDWALQMVQLYHLRQMTRTDPIRNWYVLPSLNSGEYPDNRCARQIRDFPVFFWLAEYCLVNCMYIHLLRGSVTFSDQVFLLFALSHFQPQNV